MSKAKSRPIRAISWHDEVLRFIMQWIAKRILDFLWERTKEKLKFEGQIRFRHRIFVMFGVDFLMIMFNLLIYVPEEKHASDYQDLLRRFLRLHSRYHQLAGNEACCICLNVNLVKSHFQKYVPDPKLYPPFNF
jgi:hypothetical protein